MWIFKLWIPIEHHYTYSNVDACENSNSFQNTRLVSIFMYLEFIAIMAICTISFRCSHAKFTQKPKLFIAFVFFCTNTPTTQTFSLHALWTYGTCGCRISSYETRIYMTHPTRLYIIRINTTNLVID